MRAKKPKGKGKGKGKGKPSKPTSCPESAEIIAMAAEKYAGKKMHPFVYHSTYLSFNR